jgi:hypothetical protein
MRVKALTTTTLREVEANAPMTCNATGREYVRYGTDAREFHAGDSFINQTLSCLWPIHSYSVLYGLLFRTELEKENT